MFKRPHTTGFGGPFFGTLLCLMLVPLAALADPPASDSGGMDQFAIFNEPDSELLASAGGDYSVRSLEYFSEDQFFLNFDSTVPDEFPALSVMVESEGNPEVRDSSGFDDLQAVSVNKIRVRQKVVDWVKARSPAAGAVTHLLIAKPDTGWHLAIDPGDEVMLEWKVTF